MRIGIVTDSVCDLTITIAEKYKIAVVPGIVYVGDHYYLSGVDIFPEDIENILRSSNKKIKTGAPSPVAYYKVYESLYDRVDIILSIHCPVGYSTMLQVAKFASKRLPIPSRVHHFECGVATIGLGLTVIAAAIAAEQSEDIDILDRQIKEFCERIQIIASLDSFDNLRRGGCLPAKFLGLLATALSIKPVSVMYKTKINLIGKARDRQKALDLLTDSLINRIDQKVNPHIIGLSQFGCLEESEAVEKRIAQNIPRYDIIHGTSDPMVATHIGPGLIALAYFSYLTSKSKVGG